MWPVGIVCSLFSNLAAMDTLCSLRNNQAAKNINWSLHRDHSTVNSLCSLYCNPAAGNILCSLYNDPAMMNILCSVYSSQVAMKKIYVTLHHEMSRNVPDGHFHVFIFSENKFYPIYNGDNHFLDQRTSGRATCFWTWWYDIWHFGENLKTSMLKQ